MDSSATPAAPPVKPRAPVPVVGAVVLLWLTAAALGWLAAVSTLLTAFRVSTLPPDPVNALAFLEPLLFAAVAAAVGLLAVKVWTGRDWARRVVLLLCAVVLVTALLTRAALDFGSGLAGALAFALLLVLVAVPSTQHWCDRDSPRHSPRIGEREEPPFLVVAELVLLWAAVAAAAYFSAQALRLNEAGETSTRAALALAAAVVVHGALNLALTRRREWARIATAGLSVAYALALVVAAVTALAGGEAWAAPAALAVVPAAFAWALLNAESKSWCRRGGGSAGTDTDTG
ncbi:hypothetical protein [Glycomyces albidus]|uniref:Uncharacterized protein n=1 Tax=Glycomyces albidus TaxID=2656774 RepID=A0A6L5GE43_9ACTN|nr:hypothetical protein [Glycomyces albidus]MQM27972.1 hypothetical protein [Glycomyces albidus]